MAEQRNPLRQSLWPLSTLYAGAVMMRNAAFTRGWRRVHELGVPVVSVGNLTVGGTGKTPTVCWLVEQALAAGRRPGVLARGYGRARGDALNDEGMLLDARFPGLPQVQDPDRVAAGRQLLNRHPDVDVLVLDDGFQHRRLGRAVDVVCLDATRPFAQGSVLPAGDLREPRSGLRRADVLILTRADGLDRAAREARLDVLRRVVGRELPTFFASHTVRDVVDEATEEVLSPPTALAGRPVWLACAIARPQSFVETVTALGADVRGVDRFGDHHRYTAADLDRVAARAGDALLLTTEKDAVKWRRLESDATWATLRIDLAFLGDAPRPDQVGLS